MMNLINTDRT